VPSALAVGEKNGIDGMRFMRAVALGYDIGPRVTATLGKIQYMAESHRSTHAISGTFGSAAAAGCAASLNARQMRWLLSYTAQLASGLASWQRDTEHVESVRLRRHAGQERRDRRAAGRGRWLRRGRRPVGVDNFFQAFVPKNDPAMLVDKLGERARSREPTSRNGPSARRFRPARRAREPAEEARLRAGRVKQVVVRVATNEAKIVNNRKSPTSACSTCAVMLVDKTVTFKSAHDTPRMKDPRSCQRAKVQLVPDSARTLPSRRAAIVEVTLMDGRTSPSGWTMCGHVRESDGAGRDHRQGARSDHSGARRGRFQKLSDRIFDLEHLKNVRELRPLIQRG
jgi:2-methylcitrate dehydratase PrpD